MRRLPKILWVILAVFAFVNGLEALRYLLPYVPFPAEIDNFIHRRITGAYPFRCTLWVARSR